MREDFPENRPEEVKKEFINPGLYLVSTPIGNLEDITIRALKILKNVDLILCEDTRHSQNLLRHYGIQAQCAIYNDFNKEKRSPGYLEKLQEGQSLAMISDAGTPGIADPGFYLVRMAKKHDIAVYPIPGPNALLAALISSGLPTDRFGFQNFPPKKSASRKKMLSDLKERYTEASHAPTLGFYVSPYNIKAFCEEIGQAFGDVIQIRISREITKKFEEHFSGTPGELKERFDKKPPKGEFVLLFHPQNKG